MANLEKLVAHLGIVITEGDETGTSTISLADDLPVQETISAPNLSNASNQTIEMGSPQLNWGLSDLDLEAIAQSFRLDSELHYLMHPVGI
jgi:hypothetical protein